MDTTNPNKITGGARLDWRRMHRIRSLEVWAASRRDSRAWRVRRYSHIASKVVEGWA
jgi:hypothetical protein